MRNLRRAVTETSPVASSGHIKSTLAAVLDDEGKAELRTTVGQPLLGVDARVVSVANGEEQPWDGESSGELQVRGPWVASSYYDDPRSPESFTEDGWLKTGDVATVDEHGYIRLVDRTKDVIKSGGEWISSIDLENTLMAHPGVAEATVVGLKHERWQERPVAFVVRGEGTEVTEDELREFLSERVASWWLPDKVVFVDEIPKTGTGKFDKKVVRDQYGDLLL